MLNPPLRGSYRRDIDGLRALAILPVIAHHIGIRAARGGFVGVDVFFVISGFLITQVLLEDLRGDRFSLVAFYERRIRRILPALLVVLFALFVLCLIYVLPSEFVDASRSMLAAALSVSNIYFWATSGYFDTVALSKPLLHTWSLGVEEQFYVLWPVLLAAAWRRGRRKALVLTAVGAAVSLAISAVGAFTHPSATFYWVHTRTWELLLGALLALGAIEKPVSLPMRNLLGVTGVLLILGSVVWIDAYDPFPGLLAIPPCLGAAMVILAGRDGHSVSTRVLSWKPIAFIGVISYSLYLWHWPIIVFQRNYAFLISGGPEKLQKTVILAAALAAATLSWKFVEQPLRVGARRPGRARLMRMALAGTGAVLLLALTGVIARGFPGRFSPAEIQVAGYRDSIDIVRKDRCFFEPGSVAPRKFAPECLELDPALENYLLLGDSHAAELWFGLRAAYPGVHFLQATATDCLPTTAHDLGESRKCEYLLDPIFKDFLKHHRVDRVILAAKWRSSSPGNLAPTLGYLRGEGIPVTVIGPTIIYDSPVPRLLVTANRSSDPDFLSKHWDHSLVSLDTKLASVAAEQSANYISMIGLAQRCMSSLLDAHGTPLVTDQEHFSAEGSVRMARGMRDAGLLLGPPTAAR
jgi:peptidoglycan/LPS O-acetylase OafA/YrhL